MPESQQNGKSKAMFDPNIEVTESNVQLFFSHSQLFPGKKINRSSFERKPVMLPLSTRYTLKPVSASYFRTTFHGPVHAGTVQGRADPRGPGGSQKTSLSGAGIGSPSAKQIRKSPVTGTGFKTDDGGSR